LVTSLVLLDPISILGADQQKPHETIHLGSVWGEGETALLACTILVRYREGGKRTTEAADFFS
jgi:hypothetical protein